MHWKILPLTALAIAAVLPAYGEEAPVPAAPPTTAEAPPVRTLTLQDAIAIARRNNPGLQVAEENRQRAHNRIAEVRANRFPQIGLNGSYTLQGPSSTFTIPGQGNQPPRTVQLTPTTFKQVG